MRGRRGHGTGTHGVAQHETRQRGKIRKVLHEYKEGSLRSGSKHGKPVKSRKQAIAIALSEARRGKKG